MNRIVKSAYYELGSIEFRGLFEHTAQKKLSVGLRCAMLEALREQLRSKLVKLRTLSEHCTRARSQQQVATLPAAQPSEGDLWKELDRIEQDIITRRDQKILLGSVLEDYDEELFEQQRIIEFKANEEAELKRQIEAKRKELQLQKQRRFFKEGSQSIDTTGISNASVCSPRMPTSPRLLGSPRLGRLFNWN